jgi:hypothetical protein
MSMCIVCQILRSLSRGGGRGASTSGREYSILLAYKTGRDSLTVVV